MHDYSFPGFRFFSEIRNIPISAILTNNNYFSIPYYKRSKNMFEISPIFRGIFLVFLTNGFYFLFVLQVCTQTRCYSHLHSVTPVSPFLQRCSVVNPTSLAHFDTFNERGAQGSRNTRVESNWVELRRSHRCPNILYPFCFASVLFVAPSPLRR